MYSYLVKKPSEDRVKDIVTKAVSIEQVSRCQWRIDKLNLKGSILCRFHATNVNEFGVAGVFNGGLAGRSDWNELLLDEAVH